MHSLFESFQVSEMRQDLAEMVAAMQSRNEGRPMPFAYRPERTTYSHIRRIVRVARLAGVGNTVAASLVGAWLERRLGRSVAMSPTPMSGLIRYRTVNMDLCVTAFPALEHLNAVRKLARRGKSLVLLVPEGYVQGCHQIAQVAAPDRLVVESIESFISMGIETRCEFRAAAVAVEFRQLLELYNKRVAEIEVDRSILIEIPPNLK